MVSPAEAERQIAEMFHLWLLDIESEPYPYIKTPDPEGQKQ